MANESTKSRLVAFLLVFFLGPVGAHRFYSGKIGSGIAQLILTLTFVGILVSGVWAFIDMIMIAAGKFKDEHGLEIVKW